MRSRRLQRLLVAAAMLALPVMAQAQEATLSGTVSDTTGGALPGVTVRAVHEASGNSFETVTDERGDFRFPLRIGAYRVTADLPGFASVARTITLLVGQVAVVNLQMAVSGVQESVTVTGEAPLLDVTQSSLGANIDSRQMTDLPVNGRSWTDLLMLAPGARSNSLGDIPVSYEGGNSLQSRKGGGEHATKLDGQPLTTYVAAGRDLPQFSKDAIAEFEFVPSRGDATQGRSFGVHVNAVTKSGTNSPSGSFSGYFRDDRFNAADPVAKRVLPYQNQQIVGTLGGPVVRDRLHVFGYHERERQPETSIYNTPFPHFNLDLSTPIKKYSAGVRTDYQFSSRTRLMARANYWNWFRQAGGGTSVSPSSAAGGTDTSRQFFATLTQVLSSQSVNEIRGGVTRYTENASFRLRNPGNQTYSGVWAQFNGFAGPGVELQGVVAGAGGTVQWPNASVEDMYSIRNDFTRSFVRGGRHTLKLGGEFQYLDSDKGQCQRCFGYLDATGGPVTNDLMVRVFPDLFDVSTWNLGLLSPISKSWNQTFIPPGWENVIPRKIFGMWVQDDWAMTPRLTLNLGVRYDLELNAFGNQIEMLPFLKAGRPDDKNNVGPRSGITYSLNDRTVLRAGYGLYFGTTVTAHYTKLAAEPIRITVNSDGRPDFASNPWNGPTPSYDQIAARLCTEALTPGCLTREASSAGYVQGPGYQMPYSHQAAFGLQRQIGATMAVDADYVYNGNRKIPRDVAINLTFDPATGANYPLSNVSRRVWPWWGDVHVTESGGWSNLHSFQTALTKRFSQRWQGSATYTLSWLRDADPILPSGVNADASDLQPVPFPLQPDFGGEYTLAAGDQRHRAVLNGIWDVGYGFQLSGLYFFNSGVRYFTNWGVDLRGIGGGNRGSDTRLRPDGTIVPRNNFVGEPMHRVDMRLQRQFALKGRAAITGVVDFFNLFNHANYGAYVTQEVARNYGQPSQSTNVAYGPRVMQLGFRVTF